MIEKFKEFKGLDILRQRWNVLGAREQILVMGAAIVVACALVWWVALAPALKTLRTAPEAHALLDAQLQRIRGLQQEALELQKAPRIQGDDAVRSLQSSLSKALGDTAQVSIAADRATITLKGAAAAPLAQWLAQVRHTARAVPIQAKLTRHGGARGDAPTLPVRWDGTLIMSLPPSL
ncbi:type II secretion system protein GspM [Diaphorobacter ruginosibacter]|uniref:type II secretion system protein GspM n=1 Tax=Diaphorobacter ruginosibacter TaxID=1715720 RepID=UPI00333FDEF0